MKDSERRCRRLSGGRLVPGWFREEGVIRGGVLGVLVLFTLAVPGGAVVLDTIRFGEKEEEEAHGLKAENSEIITGAYQFPARRLLPPGSADWRGGSLTFEVKVDGDEANYLTVAFWGSDVTGEHSRLMLFIDGKQVGQRHLGEVDSLDIMHDNPRFPGGFFLKTLPLPKNVTAGKESVELRIEAQGPIWGYGRTIEQYQRSMTKPSRGIYAAYVHTESWFSPPGGSLAATIPEYPVRSGPGPEMVGEVKDFLNEQLRQLVASRRPLNQEAVEFLARACSEPWCVVYRDKEALEKVVAALDYWCREFLEDEEIVERDWGGYGRLGEAVRILAGPLKYYVNEKVEGTRETREKAWTRMFEASRDWHSRNRRSYTNQSLIVDMYIYACNRAVQVLDPDSAWPEEKALRLLHESAGLEPWSGSWDGRGNPSWSNGRDQMLFTDKGLTMELGYVGGYGEIVTGMLHEAYEMTRPAKGKPGDERLMRQLNKVARVRSIFRYPLPDAEGYRGMQLESVVGWRDWYYPGGLGYEQMLKESPLGVAAATLDPVLVGIGQQMLEDNQYFHSLKKRMELRGYAHKKRLIDALSNYEIIKKQPPRATRLPMSWEQPDFVFADPEVGVVAVKNGTEVMFVSLYWRARYAVNFLARVHHITPSLERDATVWTETRFEDSGKIFEIPDRTDSPFSARHERFYKDQGMTLAVAGEKQPIAKVPRSVKGWEPGKENKFAGKGQFYLMEYGPYLVAMNCSEEESFEFEVPERFIGAMELGLKKPVKVSRVSAGPEQTFVFWRGPVKN